MDINLVNSNKGTIPGSASRLRSNSSNAVISNTDIPKSSFGNNVGTINATIPKSRSVGLARNAGASYGSTVLSNRTDRRGAVDNIKLKHQQMFGTGTDNMRNTKNPFVIN